MNKTAGKRLAALGFGITLGVVSVSAALAQMPASGPGVSSIGKRTATQGAAEKPPEAAPDVLPGARARAPAAPASRPTADMPPTEALFDAINRGDIGSARDALTRGADLDGVNVLGMTPMELSVDLGRNDISFLLLSMRGEDAGRGSRAMAHKTPDATPSKKLAREAKPKPGIARGPAPVAVKPIATPKLFANDGGTPLPSAGFLGFDPHSATN
nr:hypothetical protein [uncultured Rhodopila sp.]